MQSRAANRVASGFISIAATAVAVVATPGIAAPLAGPALAPRTHGFMLYLSQPIGGGSGVALRPKFGFRIEQVRMMGNSGAPDAGDPFQHRALVGWQMEGLQGMHAAGMKLELGGRMTYDVTHGAFAAQLPKSSSASASRPASINRPDSYTESKPFTPHLLEPRLFESGFGTREPFRMSSESAAMVHDIAAAAIGSLKLTRPAVQAPQHPGMGERPVSMRIRETN
jgi:hypothetical protein